MARGAKAFLRLSKAKKVLEVLSDYVGSNVDFQDGQSISSRWSFKLQRIMVRRYSEIILKLNTGR